MTRKEFEIPPDHLAEVMAFLSTIPGVIDLNPETKGVLSDIKPEVEKFLEEYRDLLRRVINLISERDESVEDGLINLFREIIKRIRKNPHSSDILIKENNIVGRYNDFKQVLIDLMNSHLTAEPDYSQGTTTLRQMKFTNSLITPAHVRIFIERYGLQGEKAKSTNEVGELLGYEKPKAMSTTYTSAHEHLVSLVRGYYRKKSKEEENLEDFDL